MVLDIDHDLDVEGDVILILHNPNEPFAVWADEDEPWDLPRSPPPEVDDELIQRYRLMDPACQKQPKADTFQQFGRWDDFQQVPPPREMTPTGTTEVTEAPELPVDPSDLSVGEASGRSDASEGSAPEYTGSGGDEVIGNEVSEVRFRLSSKHLISASEYFRRALTGSYKESASRVEPLPKYNISATGWDEEALKLLMDIIHGNSQNVPRSIDLDLLAKFAVLVDYYKCYDVVKFYSDTWMEEYVEFPGYSRDFVLILFVSCIFFRRSTFTFLTQMLMQQIQGPLRSLGLPFSESLIGPCPNMPLCRNALLTASADQIERSRVDAVGRLLDGFHDLLQYLSTRDSCHFKCNAILTGSLYRGMFTQGIISPRPAHPFHGFSVDQVVQMARDVRSARGSDQGVCRGLSFGTSSTCSLRDFLDPLTDQVTENLKGLELDKFVADPWGNTAFRRLVAPS